MRIGQVMVKMLNFFRSNASEKQNRENVNEKETWELHRKSAEKKTSKDWYRVHERMGWRRPKNESAD